MLSSFIHSHYSANVVMVIGTTSSSRLVKMKLVASDSVAPCDPENCSSLSLYWNILNNQWNLPLCVCVCVCVCVCACVCVCSPPDRERQRCADYASGAVQERTDQRSQGEEMTVCSSSRVTDVTYCTCALCIFNTEYQCQSRYPGRETEISKSIESCSCWCSC